MAITSNNQYFGKPCAKHPEMAGLRQKSNYTCVQCGRDACRLRSEKLRRSKGVPVRILLTEVEAKEQIRLRDLARNATRRKNPEYAAEQLRRKKQWRKVNKEKHLATCRAYDAKQLAENMQRRLSKNLRNRLSKAIRGKTRGISAVGDLGMAIPEFRIYLESKFSAGMSWENYGDWHMDHIIPLINFDLTDKDQASKACHYSNIQPLWALDNHKKGCKLDTAGRAVRGFV